MCLICFIVNFRSITPRIIMDDMELSEEQEKKLHEHSSDSESPVKMSGMYFQLEVL